MAEMGQARRLFNSFPRAVPWHGGGQEFESPRAYHFLIQSDEWFLEVRRAL